jgi:polysaccharide deacetylase family protein (PEP-CTERM system associated)
VIVPVRNEAACIRRTLERLLAQDYERDRYEVIVVDGESSDGTAGIARSMQTEHGNLRVLGNPKRFSSAGRNLGIRAARGQYMVVVDGHCDVESNRYIADVVDTFERSGADCIGRPQPLHIDNPSLLQRAIATARSSWLGHHPASWIYASGEQFVKPQSVAVAYRREVFDRLGHFDEGFDACEDVEFNHRLDKAGLRCFFSPKIRVRYHPRASVAGLFRQLCRYGRGRTRLLLKHPETFSLASVAPATFLGASIAGGLAAWFIPWLAAGLAAAWLIYALTVVLTSAMLAGKERDFRLLPWLTLVFLAIHGGAGIGVLMELCQQLARRCFRAGGASPTSVSQTPRAPAIALTSAPSGFAPKISGALNAMTIDVEDYFQVTGFEPYIGRHRWDEFESRVAIGTEKIMRLLDEASVRATFFVLGWVAERHPRLVRKLHAAGHEIGCHSYWHRLVYQQTPEEFRSDLRRARAVIEDTVGAPVTAYRAPCFSITRRSLWALDILIEEGFQFDSSIYPTFHDRYGIPGAPAEPHQISRPAGSLWEFPMAVRRWLKYPVPVGGGGYFRLYPYAVTRSSLRKINAEGRPFVVYLHPWELDPEQPRLRMGWARGLRHYMHLHRTEARLAQLLRDFRFGSISQVFEELDSQTVPQWNLTKAA